LFSEGDQFQSRFFGGVWPPKNQPGLVHAGLAFGNVANYLEANCPTKDQQILFLLNLTEFAIPKITGSLKKPPVHRTTWAILNGKLIHWAAAHLPRLSSTRTKFGQFGCETQKLKLFRKQGDHRLTMV